MRQSSFSCGIASSARGHTWIKLNMEFRQTSIWREEWRRAAKRCSIRDQHFVELFANFHIPKLTYFLACRQIGGFSFPRYATVRTGNH